MMKGPGNDPAGEAAPVPDRELVEAARRGDLHAFEDLISRYQKAVFNIAAYKSGNLFDAEDLTQDVFLAAYKALPSLKDPANFGAWLFGIAHNRCHKWFRRERTKVIKFKELRQLRETEARLAARSGPESGEENRRLAREIEDLPHEIRSVLVLKYLEGLSYQAIEARLGIKPYRIDYLIRKGKALLKQRLHQAEDTGG